LKRRWPHVRCPARLSTSRFRPTCRLERRPARRRRWPVALLAALACLRGESPSPADLARSAHRLETGRLGLQSGIQDQIAASYGGINFVEMPSYPDALVSPLTIRQETRIALEERFVLVYLGRAHRSSDVHEDVIRSLREGTSHALDMLREAAALARDALLRGDLEAFGAALAANTEGQRQLHPSLVGEDASRLVELASSVGALGWKVNGAGGEGGSIAVLLGDSPDEARSVLLDRLRDVSPRCATHSHAPRHLRRGRGISAGLTEEFR
jgi:D-glycero-alpha-D-manno-heptose-7-phosphate kinase